MTSCNFSYGVLVAFSLTSFTSLELKIHMPKYLSRLYFINLNIPFATKLSISCHQDSSNGFPGIVIMPSYYSFVDNSISACSLFVIKVIEVLVPLVIAVMNCSLKSLLIGHLQLRLPLQMVITGQILLHDSGGCPWPWY